MKGILRPDVNGEGEDMSKIRSRIPFVLMLLLIFCSALTGCGVGAKTGKKAKKKEESKKQPVVVESVVNMSMNGRDADYAFILENPNQHWILQDIPYKVTVFDANGKELNISEEKIDIVDPGQKAVVTGSTHVALSVPASIKVDFSCQTDNFTKVVKHAGIEAFSFNGIWGEKAEWDTHQGQKVSLSSNFLNNSPYKIDSFLVGVVLRKDGKMVSARTETLGEAEPGYKQISILDYFDDVSFDTVELYAREEQLPEKTEKDDSYVPESNPKNSNTKKLLSAEKVVEPLEDSDHSTRSAERSQSNSGYSSQQTLINPGSSDTESNSDNSSQNIQETPDNNTGNNNNGQLNPEWKALLDSYEGLVDQYIAAEQNYEANPTDETALNEYQSCKTQMNDYYQKLQEFEASSDSLSYADLDYYNKVMARVYQKTAGIS